MGFEYKIITTLNDVQIKAINDLVEQNQYTTVREDGWADINIKIEKESIYICKNVKRNFWEGIEKIKEYLDEKSLLYTIEEL